LCKEGAINVWVMRGRNVLDFNFTFSLLFLQIDGSNFARSHPILGIIITAFVILNVS